MKNKADHKDAVISRLSCCILDLMDEKTKLQCLLVECLHHLYPHDETLCVTLEDLIKRIREEVIV